MYLTIITPTYNRGYTLCRLYESLKAQTCKDFEWIVIDDGSNDKTRDLVCNFQKENILDINYIYKENGGKPSAHNEGVLAARGEMTICVDSDDSLAIDAVEVAKKIWNQKNNTNIIGILAKRGDFVTHTPICAKWPSKLKECKMIELQEKYGFYGDTALFFKTKLLKENLFKIFKNEKFIPEDSIYVQLDKCGKMLLLNKVLYYCEYLPDGLTAKYRKLLLENPMGTSYCYYLRMKQSHNLYYKLKNSIISEAYLLISKRPCEYEKYGERVFWLLAKLIAPIYIKIKKLEKINRIRIGI